jgi:hypothetical protein
VQGVSGEPEMLDDTDCGVVPEMGPLDPEVGWNWP